MGANNGELNTGPELAGMPPGASFRGYLSVVEQINKGRDGYENMIEAADQATMLDEFGLWFNDDRQAYIKAVTSADPEIRFVLVAMPNEMVTGNELLEDAKDFSDEQPLPAQIYPEIIAQYTADEVSNGVAYDGGKFKFALVPNKLSPELHGSVDEQQRKLAELQIDYPFLVAPTPFIDMAYRHTCRTIGEQLAGPGTDEATHMRSFSMEPKPLEDTYYVPVSFIDDEGQLMISYSRVLSGHDGRVLVG